MLQPMVNFVFSGQSAALSLGLCAYAEPLNIDATLTLKSSH